jgi:hypothetical protein
VAEVENMPGTILSEERRISLQRLVACRGGSRIALIGSLVAQKAGTDHDQPALGGGGQVTRDTQRRLRGGHGCIEHIAKQLARIG